ncbi:MAG: MBL fold metallo-hydrolase [Phycisphaerae bacterium]|nr:MBL fold metallo-hydrolase [Phycisphaerae bacterium]
MIVKTFECGQLLTNNYVIYNPETSNCIVIDIADNPVSLFKFIDDNNLKPVKLLLTHGHSDHIAGLGQFRQKYGDVPVAIGTEDAEMITNEHYNLSALMGLSIKFDPAQQLLEDGDTIEFESLEFQVIAVPGHTKGGMAFYCPQLAMAFVGDTLFTGGMGRYDFPGGCKEQLVKGVKEKLFALPKETITYSGHGPGSTIGYEKKCNPCFW